MAQFMDQEKITLFLKSVPLRIFLLLKCMTGCDLISMENQDHLILTEEWKTCFLNRKGDYVKNKLISTPELIDKGKDWQAFPSAYT